ncbi:MAG: type II secretion system protein [Saccharospirillaceae bacterium]|nr:type II secretion system GspH family protein [Pseudomonadales bacterium]NRB80165.1 type II secretion system protein [Saccharospirillaceae bacterium]
MTTKQNGFTLIELIMVIVILGILSAFSIPKFFDVSQKSIEAKNKSVASSYKSSIYIARSKLLVTIGIGAADDLKVYDTPGRYGTIDFNQYGWPSQSYIAAAESNPTTNNSGDCTSLWTALMQTSGIEISTSNDKDYQIKYVTSAICQYYIAPDYSFGFEYNSNTGAVIII